MHEQSSEWNPRGGAQPAPSSPFEPAALPPSIPPSIVPNDAPPATSAAFGAEPGAAPIAGPPAAYAPQAGLLGSVAAVAPSGPGHPPTPHGDAPATAWAGSPPVANSAPPAAPLTALERLRSGGGRPASAQVNVPRINPALVRPAARPGALPLHAVRRTIGAMFLADGIARPAVEDTIRAQQPLTTGRRLLVLGAHPQAGTTTSAVTLAQLLAGVRREQVALLASNPDPAPLAIRTGVMPGPSADAISGALARGRIASRDELVAAMDHLGGNLWSLAWQESWESSATADLASEFSRYFGATIVDGGTVHHRTTPALVTSAHVTILVAQASREGMQAAEAAFAMLAGAGLVNPARFIISLIQTRRSQRIDLRWEARMVRRQGIRSVSIPFDPHLADDTQIRTDFLTAPAQQAFIEMLGDAIDSSMTKG